MDKKDDRLTLWINTDLKTKAKIQALKLGYKSVADYINDLIKKDMKIDEKEK